MKNTINKKCCKCNKIKEISCFSPDKRGKFKVGSVCKVCSRDIVKEYSKTKNGLITKIYSHQKSHSKDKKYKMPEYTKQMFYEWITNQKEFHLLYDNWVESGYKKDLIPSVDRINDYIHYRLDNIQVVTWEYNNKKGHKNRLNGINNKTNKRVAQLDMNRNIIKIYHSISEAGRNTNADFRNISAVCNGRLKTTGGFGWTFI